MAYGELGVEREIGRVGIFVTNKIIIYTFLQKTHPAATYVKMLRGIFKMRTEKHDFF